jgi:hypothetical protein
LLGRGSFGMVYKCTFQWRFLTLSNPDLLEVLWLNVKPLEGYRTVVS